MGPDRQLIGGTKYNSKAQKRNIGAARTDYPMLPVIKDKVYYFEVKLAKASEKG